MKRLFFSRYIFIALFVLAAIMQGCREGTLINSKVSPAINTVNLYSTSLSCITKTYYDDTVVTSTTLPGISMLQGVGNILDPYFGTMTGATFFQVLPLDLGFGVYDGMTIDSAVMVLPYGGYTYGDTSGSGLQTFQVFYASEPITRGEYYAYDTKSIDATYPLSEPTTADIRQMSAAYDTVTLVQNFPGLRIKLKLPTILHHLLHADSAMLNSTTPSKDFLNAFNGICVRVADTRKYYKSYPYFQLDGNNIYTQAGILVYYHKTADPNDTVRIEPYYFDAAAINAICGHFNSVSRSYSHYPVNKLYTSTAANDEVIALQNQPGAAIDIYIPGLKSLPAGVINKAELQLPILPGSAFGNYLSTGRFLGPEKIYPTGIGNGTFPSGVSTGLSYILSDYFPLSSLSPLSVLDGYVHTVNRNGTDIQVYTINIPREVMTSVKAGNDTIHLHLNGTQDYYGAGHLLLGGGSYPDTLYRPKLFVVYSKLN